MTNARPMSDAERAEHGAEKVDPEWWRYVEIDDETIEQLRRLLFGNGLVPVKH